MSLFENYHDRTFLVTDPDARIRVAGDLQKFETYKIGEPLPDGASVGDFKRIPIGTEVRVEEIDIAAAGSKAKRIFARALSANGATLGWTSTRNFEDRFRNVTLGLIAPAPGAGQFSATAAWSKGTYLGQVSLARIVDAGLEIENLAEAMVGPYFDMRDAAAGDGVSLYINSGFRSYPEQKALYDGYKKGLPGYNLAARPGRSNHQNGIALDIPVAGGAGNPEYDWLAESATTFGFIRTVKSEPWHWEYRPDAADAAKANGSHKLWE